MLSMAMAIGASLPTHAQEAERTPHASMFLTAPTKANTTISFPYYGDGKEFRVLWGMDTAWNSSDNVTRGTNYIGKENMGTGRVSFQPNDLVTEAGELTTAQQNALRSRLRNIAISGVTDIALNCDHEALNDRNGFANYKGKPVEWYRLIKASVKYCRNQGYNVVSVSPFNEPDYAGWNEGSKDDFKEIARLINEDPELEGIRVSAGNTLNCDQALSWYNYMKPYVQEGCTHQLAGSFDTYANFFTTVRNDGNWATADELHNVGEAIVGVEYGMQSGIWWGYDGIARGEFCRANVEGGARLGYGENRSRWTSGAVYRMPDGRVKGFLGSSERQANTTTFDFFSTDEFVYFDGGYGPTSVYQMTVPGGTGYQSGQTNAERLVHIYAGEDVPPFELTDSTFVIMNKKSKLVMSAGSSSNPSSGADVQQRSYGSTGASNSQKWKLEAVSERVGGDYSYYFIRNAFNTSLLLDVNNWSTSVGGKIIAYPGGGGALEQWNFEYAGDGDWYIRSRHSGWYLQVRNGSNAAGTVIEQAAFTGEPQQRWRLIPTDAARDLDAPAVPVGLTATEQPGSVLLTWEANTEADLNGYMILRGETLNNGDVRWAVIGRQIQGTRFIDNSCTLHKPYQYKIRAIDRCANMSEATAPITAQTEATPGLVARYTFDNTMEDASVNTADAVLAGAAAYATNYTQTGTHSLNMNGTANYMVLPRSVASSRTMTVTAWIRPTATTQWQRVFDFGNGTDQYMFLTTSNGEKKLALVMKNGGDEQILAAENVRINAWHHVAVTIDEEKVAIYLDGELAAESSDITIRSADFQPVRNYIGRSQFDADPYYKGYLDDFRVYNYALAPEEIAATMTDFVDAIDGVPADAAHRGTPVATEYYTANGVRLTAPLHSGITLIRYRYADGSTSVRKVMY